MEYAYLILDDDSDSLVAIRYEADHVSPAIAQALLDECAEIIPEQFGVMGCVHDWAKISAITFSDRGDFPGLESCDPHGIHHEKFSDIAARILHIERNIGWVVFNDESEDQSTIIPEIALEDRLAIIASYVPEAQPSVGLKP